MGKDDVDRFLNFDSLIKNSKYSLANEKDEANREAKQTFSMIDHWTKHNGTLKKANKFEHFDIRMFHEKVIGMPKAYVNFLRLKLEYNDFWNLADCIIKGDFKKYSDIEIEFIHDIKNNHVDKNLRVSEIRKEITKGLVGYTVDQSTRANLIMYLCTQKCEENKEKGLKHTYCELMKMLLDSLSVDDRYAILTAEFAKTKFTALHFATMMGSPCCLMVLLTHGVNSNINEKTSTSVMSPISPMIYALMRDNISFVKVLLLFGCSIIDCVASYPNSLICTDFGGKIQQRINFLKRRLENMKITFKEWCSQYIKGFTVKEVVSNVHILRGACYTGRCKSYPIDKKYLIQTQIIHVDMECVNGQNQDYLQNGIFPVIVIIPFNYNTNELGGCISEFHATRVKFVCDNNENKKETVVKYLYDNLKMEGTCTGTLSYPVLPLTIDPEHNGYYYMFRIPDNIINISQLKITYDIRNIKNPQYLNLAIALVNLQKIR
ncbi:Ankyrin repeat and Ankyrin repeat-containing domain-containing protein [Strongyloides ratti]|uniref:Ankyrin repeat and Ankyrin repeat-containing domain-containing protein n=1 Tax=Strongyloides ratti TaxID=34506 RepID=A0A090L488_STRRB|nr:Ankyrin repeat and Ankyrin repeat-containing domain-containing protein [Strongyloides ratti]CEF62932.1 Ankyrin repeat and Ankyrin repeat-containing domain-containing protein [Strongyloides ratti]